MQLFRHTAVQHVEHRRRAELKCSVKMKRVFALPREFELIATDDERDV